MKNRSRRWRNGWIAFWLALAGPAWAWQPPSTVPASGETDSNPSLDREKAGDAEDQPDANPMVDPDLFRIRFLDGMEIEGKLSIDQFEVDTAFGVLEVPLRKIHQLSPGLHSRTEFYSQVLQWIDDLAAADQQQRDLAQAELLALGLPIRGELEQYRDDENPERAQRIKALLEKLDELAEDLEDDFFDTETRDEWIRADAVDTTRFRALGRVLPQTFDVTTKYGTITVQLGDVEWLQDAAGTHRRDAKRSLSVGGQNLAQLKYKSTGIDVEPGDKVRVRASGMISRAGSSSYVSTPDGSSRFGQFMPSPAIPGGALVARLGDKGEVIQVGSKNVFTAKRSGTLQFAIGMRPDYVGRYQFLGAYDVRVKVERADQ